MKTDRESAVAIDTTFNSIVKDMQLSNLNFTIQLTPYAAYITLKKSTQVNRNGLHANPSPPESTLLQQSYRDQTALHEEIKFLKEALSESEQRCNDLQSTNASIILKLEATNDKLSDSEETNMNLIKKLDYKKKEVEQA